MATTGKKSKGESAPGAVPVSDVPHNHSTALYGPSGTGKTTLAATWPLPMLYLNINDDGTDSINDVDGVEVVDITTTEQLRDLLLWCHEKAQKGKLKYKSVCMDTITQLQQMFVNEMGVNANLKKHAKDKKPGDYGTLTKQDWGVIAGNLKAAIMDIRNLPVASIFIAQQRVFNLNDEEDDGIDQLAPEVGPRLMPSVKDDLNASVSIIGNTFIRIKVKKEKVDGKNVTTVKKLYCLRVGPNEIYTTKIRKPKRITAPDYITDPTFDKIMAIVKGKK
jgi:hypothetical protein